MKAMLRYPAYLHPYLDTTGELQPVPPEIFTQACQTCSCPNDNLGFSSDAAWFGVVEVETPDPALQAGLCNDLGGIDDPPPLTVVSGPTDPPTGLRAACRDAAKGLLGIPELLHGPGSTETNPNEKA